ncbi:MAG TPA: ABC transporter permease, partial [Polyangia bacterium]
MEMATQLGWWGVPLAVLGGALRVSTPFLFVSLGECLTEKSGRVNLGLEGTLVMGAMVAFGGSYLAGSPFVGVGAALVVGALFGALHGWLCGRPRVNDIAVGIALMLLGVGLAFFLGKPLIKPSAPQLPALPLGNFSEVPAVRAALQVNVLFIAGVLLAFVLRTMLRTTRWGLVLRTVGESADAARAMGHDVGRIRFWATTAGGALAGVGGAFLS